MKETKRQLSVPAKTDGGLETDEDTKGSRTDGQRQTDRPRQNNSAIQVFSC